MKRKNKSAYFELEKFLFHHIKCNVAMQWWFERMLFPQSLRNNRGLYMMQMHAKINSVKTWERYGYEL